MSADNDTPRRETVSGLARWQAELIERLTERTPRAAAVPVFEIDTKPPPVELAKQGFILCTYSKVTIPVCDEYPTSPEAFSAARMFMDELRAAYPPLRASDGLTEALEATVAKMPKRGKP